jgi:ABC-type multidrug transport system ATPase subunit
MQVSIRLEGLGKKFVNEWIFRNLSRTISPSEKIVVLGANGSGKSTLLQTVASFIIPTNGTVRWNSGNSELKDDEIYRYLSIASPYMELMEDFTLREMVEHQQKFKPYATNLSSSEVIEILQLKHASEKYLKNFSSGMKQRVKLGLAILADCPVLLLDEPCTNLDAASISWYLDTVKQFALHKTILVCSNAVKEEYAFCDQQLEIENYKK